MGSPASARSMSGIAAAATSGVITAVIGWPIKVSGVRPDHSQLGRLAKRMVRSRAT